jgi:zinc protease
MTPVAFRRLGTVATASLFAVAATRLLVAAEPNNLDPVVRAAAAVYEGVRVETLPNGLRVFLKPIPGSPTVSTMMAYKVGSSDEELNATGLSHYLEHLMFKGTEKLMPGDIDRLTQRSGGRNNAYTTEDMTVYHFDFAADQWETGLAVEADRMRNLRIDAKHEFEQEKGAVISELQMNEDQPYDLEYKVILPELFGKTTPYGHPVIGEREHVKGATAAVIKGHYDRWYYPNNASLIVCGGFDEAKALAKIKDLFGSIPKGELPARKQAPPAETRSQPVHKEMPSKFDVPRMIMGFNSVRQGDPDYYSLEVASAVLSNGRTSRLYKKLVEETNVASEIACGQNTGRYPGWFAVQLELLKGQPRDKAEQLVLDEFKKLADEPVSTAELNRVRRTMLSGAVFGREGVHELADSIARGVTVNDLNYLKNYLVKINSVTPADVQAVAKKYLDASKRVVVWSVPQASGGGADKAKDKPGAMPTALRGHGVARMPTALRGHGTRLSRGAEAGGSTFSLKGTKRVQLPNGLTLLLLENHRLPIVVADAYIRNVRLTEPENMAGVANLVGSMLDEGTATRSGPQIATTIEDVGGSLTFGAAGGSVKVLSPDRTLGLELLIDCLTRPSFPSDALERKRAQTLSAIDDAEKRADAQAQRKFSEMVYGPAHPMGRPAIGKRPVVEKLTGHDCRTFHAARFLPNLTILAIVGDFDSQKVVDEVTKLTAHWKSQTPIKPELPAVQKPAEFKQTVLTMPQAEQLYFFMGHPGIRRDNPDFYKLLVMDNVLGTGPGFTDRLSAQLRDREGLAYSVSAAITSTAGEQPGTFTCYISTFPDKFAAVKDGFLKELRRIRAEPPTAEEVEDAKKYLLGSVAFKFTTNDAVASQLLLVERHHLGFGYLDDYKSAVAAVKPADVLAVARKYLDPEHMVLVAAGAVTPDGKPMARPK